MNVNHINSILQSFSNVMPQLGMSNVEKRSVTLKEKLIQSPGVVVIIGIIGDIKGNIIYGMTVEDAKKIASIMMMGMPVENFDELSQSAISELINMLTANVATNFSNEDICIDISTPTLVQGNFVANVSIEQVVCVQMSVNEMLIDVNISFKNV